MSNVTYTTGDVVVLDATSGHIVHAVAVRGYALPQRPPLVDDTTGRVFVAGTTFPTGQVSMLDIRSGQLIRTIHVVGWVGGLALDRRTGQVFVADSGPMASRVIIHGSLHIPLPPVPIGAGSVAVLDGRSGHLRRTFHITGVPAGIVVDEQGNRVYVANTGRGQQVVDTHPGSISSFDVRDGPGSVVVLNAQTGVIVRTATVGVSPGLLAVDARAGRVYAINEGGLVKVVAPWAWVPRWLQQHLPFRAPPGGGLRRVPSSISLLATG
jgi:DNA-binding beta-propeller fold protein YncE